MSLEKSQRAHRTAGLVYCLWLLGILFGITAIIGVYISHTRLPSARGTHAYSHLVWQIGSFWTVFAGVVLTFIFMPHPVATVTAVLSFAIWLFSGMIGSYLLAKSRKFDIFDRLNRNIPRDPRAPRDHEVYDTEGTT